MKKKRSSIGKMNPKFSEGVFSLPRTLAMLAICALAVTPFLPWLQSATESSPVTLKQLTTHLVNSKVIAVNLWPLPIILAVLFLLPLLTDLRLTRGVYYLLLIGTLVASALFLYPSANGLLVRAGIDLHTMKPHYGLWVFLLPFPLLMISGLSDLLKSRLGIVILLLSFFSTGTIVVGNLTGWFGYLTGQPSMWHEQYDARLAQGGPAVGVHLNVLNDGWGILRLGLSPANLPEVNAIISAQRHYRIGDFWADTPIEDLLTPPSKSLLPAELKPGDVVVLDLIFGPLTSEKDLYSVPMVGASGRYAVSLTDAARHRIYQHEIAVPPAPE
jgi:hypothetical protein